MSANTKLQLLIVQSRGIGDIVIALPIARYYGDLGYEIHWPVLKEFVPHFREYATYIHFHPLESDAAGNYFLARPLEIGLKLGIPRERTLVLYQSLRSHPELSKSYGQHTHFDEFKYARAQVPLINKWTLDRAITVTPELNARAERLKQLLLPNPQEPYYVTHFEGSDAAAAPDLSNIPKHWTRIDIGTNAHKAASIFEWLEVIKHASALIAIDSCIANMVDQLTSVELNALDKYWIPRSHIQLCPTLGQNWTRLEPIPNSTAAQVIFQ